ncbi:Slp family lipoprotein [Arhodomonas aquaeolei]|uniref:Slp family lipoprotein n=1 Tax=Arhodomonas aquaeolei TaxID=2369 RepID=UPI002166D006|nr:Slp family lipoprotein [Arhodomonas aquaeolei]MCS4503511.1 Slp family lipoprotein [Arhodomonas aquaeolei]
MGLPLPLGLPCVVKRAAAAALLAGMLAGCAAGPVRETGATREPLPAALVAGGDAVGREVVWGGRVVDRRPDGAGTRLEVLAFPLRGRQQPNVYWGEAGGRFLAVSERVLSTDAYAPGRRVTVRGTVTGLVDVRIGNWRTRWPRLAAEAVYAWPRERDPQREPIQFHLPGRPMFSD